MKLYGYKNRTSKSDFITEDNLYANHSAAIIILAKSKKEAQLTASMLWPDIKGDITEIPTITAGLVVFADGEC